MKKVFISGPYTLGDVCVNVKKAMDMANKLINSGYIPFCPHLFHFLHIHNPHPYNKWMEIDIEFLKHCDAVIRIPGESKGAEIEVSFAEKNNIPVFYTLNKLKKYLL